MQYLVAAHDIVKIATETAKKNKLKSISKIVIRLGKIIENNQELTPKKLLFDYDLVKRNTIADKSKLVIKRGKGRELSIIEVQGEK